MLKISVVIPVYNMEKYLEQCIKSIREQTLLDIELICINDGSTDSSLDLLEAYCEQDSRIRVITQENKGVGAARNRGIREAKGEYVAFMDPDDYYLDERILEDLYQAATAQGVQICGGSLSEDHKDGQWIRKEFLGVYTKYTFEREGYVEYKDYQFDYGFYRFIYNREFLIKNEIFFPPYIRFQDPPFFVKAMVAAEKFYALPRVTYCYRYGHQNLKWDEERICAILNGFIDNLTMSREEGLSELHYLTVDRMLREYKDKIILGLESRSDKVLRLLLEADSQIDRTGMPDDSGYKEGVVPLIYEWEQKEVEREKIMVQQANAEYENIKNSTTFKVGKKIMAIPIKVKEYCEGNKESCK